MAFDLAFVKAVDAVPAAVVVARDGRVAARVVVGELQSNRRIARQFLKRAFAAFLPVGNGPGVSQRTKNVYIFKKR